MKTLPSASNPSIATIKILDELNAVVIGLDRTDYKELYNKYGLFSEGYFFKPAYKSGRWDGKIRFFSNNGKTSVNLLPEIIPDLKNMGYKIRLLDHRSLADVTVPEIDKNYFNEFMDQEGDPIVLGEHQVLGINAITANNGGILLAGTGAGKSYCCAALVDLYNKNRNFRCLVIVPNKDLINQTAADIAAFDIDVGRFFGDVKEPNQKNVVSTWQSLQNTPTLMAGFQVIIVDECHGAKADVLKNMILEHGSNSLVRIGLTGTLPKEPSSAMSVRYVLGDVRYEVPAHVLIDKGWLAKLKLRGYVLIENLKAQWNFFQQEHPEESKKTTYAKFKRAFYVEYSDEKSALQKNTKRTQFLASLVDTAVKSDGNTFVLVNGIPFGKKLAAEIQKSIPNTYFVYGQDEVEVRKQIYALFAEHDNVVVVTTFQLASTGLNIKRIFNLFLIDPGKSFIQIIQSIGRGLRKAKDKDSVNVYDISSDLKYASSHRTKRKSYYKEQKYAYEEKEIDYEKLIDFFDY